MDIENIAVTAVIVIVVVIAALVGFKAIRNTRSIEGTVVDKKFIPARTTTRTKTRSVSMHGDPDHRIPQTSIETRTIPDTWRVIVEPSDGSSKVTRKVPEERWNEIEIGDHWED